MNTIPDSRTLPDAPAFLPDAEIWQHSAGVWLLHDPAQRVAGVWIASPLIPGPGAWQLTHPATRAELDAALGLVDRASCALLPTANQRPT